MMAKHPFFSMFKLLCSKPLSVALAGAAGVSFLISTPAKAATISCGLIDTIQDLINNGSCISRGAKVTYNPSLSGFAATDFVSISTTGTLTPSTGIADSLTFSVQGNPNLYIDPFTGVLKYSITAPDGRSIIDYTSALASSTNLGNNTGTFDLTGLEGPAKATYKPVNISQTGTKTYASTSVLTDAFIATVGVTQGSIESFTQSFNFQNTPIDPPGPGPQGVPGPLPVLGAGIAFGYSRKLRKRIAAS
jgi:hypothetical protein